MPESMPTIAVYERVWPVVFQCHTRPLERAKGHSRCTVGIRTLAPECLDGFHDDVEAVLYKLERIEQPIADLEAWVARSTRNATVDAYRRRRGERGAPQRDRVPQWLAAELDEDRWLVELAALVIDWVGRATTAGLGVWPLDVWGERRALHTGTAAGVGADLAHVLDAMRHKPRWYADRIEQPLGRKQAPVTTTAPELAEPLLLGEHSASLDRERAAMVISAVEDGLAAGGDPTAVVQAAITTFFLDHVAGSELAAPPVADARLADRMADERELACLVAAVLDVLSQ